MTTSQTLAAIAIVAAAVLAGAYFSGHLAEEDAAHGSVADLEPPVAASRAASADPAATVPEKAPDAH